MAEFATDLISGIQTIAGFDTHQITPATVGMYGLRSQDAYLGDSDVTPEIARDIARLLLNAADLADRYNAEHFPQRPADPPANLHPDTLGGIPDSEVSHETQSRRHADSHPST